MTIDKKQVCSNEDWLLLKVNLKVWFKTSKAVKALSEFLENKKKEGKTQLIDDHDYFDLQIMLQKSLGEAKNNPVLL